MHVEQTVVKDWSAFKFDATDSLRKLTLFHVLNGICWAGTVITLVLFIQDMLMGNFAMLNLHFILLILLSFVFGFGTFQCEKTIRFIRYQLSHFSTREQQA